MSLPEYQHVRPHNHQQNGHMFLKSAKKLMTISVGRCSSSPAPGIIRGHPAPTKIAPRSPYFPLTAPRRQPPGTERRPPEGQKLAFCLLTVLFLQKGAQRLLEIPSYHPIASIYILTEYIYYTIAHNKSRFKLLQYC